MILPTENLGGTDITKKQRAEEIIRNGEVIFEKHVEYFNKYTGKMCHEHLRHIKYNGQVWDVDFINGRVYSLFALKTK